MKRTQLARRRRKRRQKRQQILSIFLILFLSIVAYGIYEYQAGYQKAFKGGQDLPPIDNNTENPDSSNDNFKGKKNELGKTNVLILGVDGVSGGNKARTDTIMIAQYDPKNNSAKLVSIMRDSYVSIPGYKDNKINTAFYHGGVELLRQTIKENFGIDVEYYSLVNFDGFTRVVDVVAPKGIEVDVEKRMYYTDPTQDLYIDLQAGTQKLDGEKLLHYARFRNDSESDFGRVRRQQEVISLVKDEFLSVNGFIKLPRLLGTLEPYIDTNIKTTNMLTLAKDFVVNPVSEIETMRIPVDGTYENSYYQHAGSVLDFNRAKNKQALQQFFSSPDTSEQTAQSTNEDAKS